MGKIKKTKPVCNTLCQYDESRNNIFFSRRCCGDSSGKKIADVLNVTVDYLLTGNNMMVDKKLLKRMEDIEALPQEEKEKVYYFIDMALSHHKAKRAFAK